MSIHHYREYRAGQSLLNGCQQAKREMEGRGKGGWRGREGKEGEREHTHSCTYWLALLWDDATHIQGRSPPLVNELSWETSSGTPRGMLCFLICLPGIFNLVFIYFVWVWLGWSEDNLQESILSHHVDPRYQTQVVRLRSQAFV